MFTGKRADLRHGIGIIVLAGLFLLPLIMQVTSSPEGPGFSIISNTSRTGAGGTEVNATYNGTAGGGYIYTMLMNATSQTVRWKGFVGNVSGQLVLDDVNGQSIYTWTLNSTFSGEVYATRYGSSVSWFNVNCSNSTHKDTEDQQLSLFQQDNISSTFNTRDHLAFAIGTLDITADSCFGIFTYVNDGPQATRFSEIMLYDYLNNVTVYSTVLETDQAGFDGKSYDFQMILPENGSVGFAGPLSYYFYVELV